MESLPRPDVPGAPQRQESRVKTSHSGGDLRPAELTARPTSEEDMVACFLAGELSSARFSGGIRAALAAMSVSETLLTQPDLTDPMANETRRAILASTRGYGENRLLFECFPQHVEWSRAWLPSRDLAAVRYIDYSYWNDLSGGTRLPADAARRILRGEQAFNMSNAAFFVAAEAVQRGDTFPPLIFVGVQFDRLVCLEGNLRLTAHALAGFPRGSDCLVGISADMQGWAK